MKKKQVNVWLEEANAFTRDDFQEILGRLRHEQVSDRIHSPRHFTEAAFKEHCDYCGGKTFDDERGHCCACGAPRPKKRFADEYYLSST